MGCVFYVCIRIHLGIHGLYGFTVFEYRCMAEKASFMNGAKFPEAASGVFTSITPILARAVVMRVTSLTPYVSLPV